MTMRPPIIPREQVVRRLAVDPAVLARFEARGLIRCVREGGVEGYEPTELRRVWTVLSLHRDAGINLAGIEAILRLRDRLDHDQRQFRRLAFELLDGLAPDADTGFDDDREETLETEVGDEP